MRLIRSSRPLALLAGLAVTGGAALIPATTAQAESRSGEVTVSIPSRIVIDGTAVPVTASSTTLIGYFDRVYVSLYNGTALQGTKNTVLNKQVDLSTILMKPGTIVGRAGLATTYCSVYSSDPCHLDNDFNWYQFVTGLTYPDSSPATAKYGSKLALAASNDGVRTTWTATAQRYGGYSWQPWSNAYITIGPAAMRTDDKGVATWVESTSDLHSFQAVAAESDDVWGATSAATQPVAPPAAALPSTNDVRSGTNAATQPVAPPAAALPSTNDVPSGTNAATQPVAPPAAALPSTQVTAPKRARSASSAVAAARVVDRRLASVRRVIKLTRSNDVNHLLGKKRGYRSAAVLVDRRLRCNGDPGVDCGATIEQFASSAKAKQRKQYIQRVLHSLPALGKEHDEVQGRFLLRISGELSDKQAKAYRKAFRSSL